jgi:hypothetical protein
MVVLPRPRPKSSEGARACSANEDLISQSIAHLLRTNEANNRLQTDQMRTWAGILVLVLVLVCIHNVLSMLCGDHEVTTITNGCLSCK